MAGLGAVETGDLAGQMFGRLISDRKFLATFYTLPASAMLLAEFAVGRLDHDFGSRPDVAGLRLADLACGTGALLSAAYRSVAARYRRSGGDDAALHAEMMENRTSATISAASALRSSGSLSNWYLSKQRSATRPERRVNSPTEEHPPANPILSSALELRFTMLQILE